MRLIRTLVHALLDLVVPPRPGPAPRHARTDRPATPREAPTPRTVPAPRQPAVPVPRPRQVARPRPYARPLALPPDYGRLPEVDTRHHALWRLTCELGSTVPYQARYRPDPAIVLAASTLAALDFTLTEFTPPAHARHYLDHHRHREATTFRLTPAAQHRVAQAA